MLEIWKPWREKSDSSSI